MRSRLVVLVAVAIAVAAGGFFVAAAVVSGATPSTTSASTGTTATGTTTSGRMTATTTTAPRPEVVFPDASLTPGVLDRKVRQATIAKTICVRGWTAKIRPPLGYTNALKRKQMALYGETGPASAYEEDHLIPLELGGAPRSPGNLWPEPRAQARKSDPLETKLKRQVCRRAISLARGRATIRAFKSENG